MSVKWFFGYYERLILGLYNLILGFVKKCSCINFSNHSSCMQSVFKVHKIKQRHDKVPTYSWSPHTLKFLPSSKLLTTPLNLQYNLAISSWQMCILAKSSIYLDMWRLCSSCCFSSHRIRLIAITIIKRLVGYTIYSVLYSVYRIVYSPISRNQD